jgi:hypothetical protein
MWYKIVAREYKVFIKRLLHFIGLEDTKEGGKRIAIDANISANPSGCSIQ